MNYLDIYNTLKAKFGEAVETVVSATVPAPSATPTGTPTTTASAPAVPVGEPFCVIRREQLLDVCHWLKDDPAMAFDFLNSISGVDDGVVLWVVYHLYSLKHNHKAVVKVNAGGRENPSVPSVAELWRAADWHEREAYDLYGIRFEGHPDLRRILLSEDWPGWPLRKDYEFPDEYQGIPLK